MNLMNVFQQRRQSMKKILSALIMLMLLMTLSVNVFAASDDDNLELNLKDRIKNLSKEYNVEKFQQEALKLNPDLSEDLMKEYTLFYTEIYDMYKEDYKRIDPELSTEEIAELAMDNMLEKIECYLAHESENSEDYCRNNGIDMPDGYEAVAIYINENLNPDYNATVDTTEENVEILKKNIDNMSEEMKMMAQLYIEDMEIEYEFRAYEKLADYINENLNPGYNATIDTTKENIEILKNNIDNMPEEMKNTATRYIERYIEDVESEDNLDMDFYDEEPEIGLLSKKSEKKAALKAVAYSKRYWKDYNSAYPNWGYDCANFVSQCLFAGEKRMKKNSSKIDDNKNWFSYGSKQDIKKVSSTWRGANNFKWHWSSRAYDYKDFDLNKSGELAKLHKYAKAGYPISFLNSKNTATHTLIIADFKDKDVGVRNHSGRADDEKTGIRWLSYDKTKVRVYKIYKL